MIEQTCRQNVGTWTPTACGKPVKGIGPLSNRPRCGIHLAAEKRRFANNEKRNTEAKIRHEHWKETKAMEADLSERCGAEVHLSQDRGTISLSRFDFERLFSATEEKGK